MQAWKAQFEIQQAGGVRVYRTHPPHLNFGTADAVTTITLIHQVISQPSLALRIHRGLNGGLILIARCSGEMVSHHTHSRARQERLNT